MKKLPALPKQLADHLSTLSPSTGRQYSRRLARFYISTGCRLSSITRRAVESYLTHLAVDGHVSASYQNTVLSALRWAVRVTSQSADLSGLTARRSTTMPAIVSHATALDILKRMDGEPYMVAALVYGSGLTLAEALALCRWNIRRNHILINGRQVPLPEALRVRLNGYGLLAGVDGRLFRVNQNTVTQAVKRAVAAAGLTQRIGTRELRHSFAARLLEQGSTIVEVKEIMGYKRLDTLLNIQSQIKTRSA